MVHSTSLGSIPSMMIMDAKSVACEGCCAGMAGELVHVTGIANELAVRRIKYQASWLVRAVGGFLSKGRGA